MKFEYRYGMRERPSPTRSSTRCSSRAYLSPRPTVYLPRTLLDRRVRQREHVIITIYFEGWSRFHWSLLSVTCMAHYYDRQKGRSQTPGGCYFHAPRRPRKYDDVCNLQWVHMTRSSSRAGTAFSRQLSSRAMSGIVCSTSGRVTAQE